MQAGHDNRRDPACRHFIVHPRTTADVLAGPVPAHDPAVPDLPDIRNGSDIIAHRITDGDPLDFAERTEAGEIGNAKILCFFPRDPELTILTGKPHSGGTVIDPDKHSSNPIAWMTY